MTAEHEQGRPAMAGLFAGIGGFELAFAEGAGLLTSILAEIDPAAQTVLKIKFPHAEIVGDVKEITELPEGTEIVTAGFPCQNLSMAGDKSGIGGVKSGEVVKLFQILERNHVPIVVIENVYFMLHLGHGKAMDWLLEQFEELGYQWAYRVLDTSGFGLPHRRRRVYLVASKALDPRSVLFADESESPAPLARSISYPLGFYWTEGRSGVGITVDGIPPLKSGSSIGIPSAPAVLFPDGEVLTPNIDACEQLQGFPPGWTESASSQRRDPRWRMLGNAVSVPAARWVASRINGPGEIIDFESKPLSPGVSWPNAAFNTGSGRTAVRASTKPISVSTYSIERFRSPDWGNLSHRALSGFLRRAHEGNLRFPDGFLDSLHDRLDKIPAPHR